MGVLTTTHIYSWRMEARPSHWKSLHAGRVGGSKPKGEEAVPWACDVELRVSDDNQLAWKLKTKSPPQTTVPFEGLDSDFRVFLGKCSCSSKASFRVPWPLVCPCDMLQFGPGLYRSAFYSCLLRTPRNLGHTNDP